MKFNYDKYLYAVAQKDEYVTSRKRGLLSYLSPSLRFYFDLVRIVLYNNIKTKFKIYNRYNWTASSIDMMESLERAGIKFHFSGMKNISAFEGPAIFIGNHMSTLETVILPSIIQPVKNVVYVIKKELAEYPVFGPVAKARHPILVGRANPREDLQIVMDEGAQRLKDGRSVIIFPQRTRAASFIPKQFNSLGVKIAKKNNVPVIPTAILSDAWANGKIVKEFGKIDPSKTVRIAFGEPMFVKGNGSEEHEKTIEFISQKLTEWGRADLIINE